MKTQNTPDIDIPLSEGKYRFLHYPDGEMKCLRYGDEWRDLAGDGMVLALAHEIERLKTINANLLSVVKRAAVELDATVRFIRKNPVSEFTVRYDGTTCDGSCLADDCENSMDAIKAAIAAATP